MTRLITDVKYSAVQFSRNRQSIFFTFVSPVLFLVLGWYLFGPTAGSEYVDYMVPGIVGIAILGSALDLTVGVIARYRAEGLLKKIALTPMSGLEWNLSRIVSGLLAVLVSVATTLFVSWLAFGYVPCINAIGILLFLAGSVMSVGLGMVIANIIKDREAANMAAFTLIFPLILVSGSIFPAGRLPSFLQSIADLSPLACLNDGLRNAMVTGHTGDAMTDLAIIIMLAIALFSLNVFTMSLRDD